MPRSAGSWSRNSSNNSFISFLLFRSASLCDTRNSGEREYGVIPESFPPGSIDEDAGVVSPDSVPAVAESGAAASPARARPTDGGRDLDLSTRDAVEVVDMVEGRFVGTDMRRSVLKGTGGTMAIGGTELGSNGRPELDPSPSLGTVED
jgi:hypothetical protein